MKCYLIGEFLNSKRTVLEDGKNVGVITVISDDVTERVKFDFSDKTQEDMFENIIDKYGRLDIVSIPVTISFFKEVHYIKADTSNFNF